MYMVCLVDMESTEGWDGTRPRTGAPDSESQSRYVIRERVRLSLEKVTEVEILCGLRNEEVCRVTLYCRGVIHSEMSLLHTDFRWR